MGKKYLLDSNTVIDYVAFLHPNKASKWLNTIIDRAINVSVITQIEVLSFNPDKDDNYAVLVDFFDSAVIFDLVPEVVNQTIHIRQRRKIKLPDAIIAATALVNKLTLISRNTKDFKNIEGLEVLNPYEM